MNEKTLKNQSKFLSLLLRHKPETIGLELDSNGWAKVEDLIQLTKDNNVSFTEESLKLVVQNNNKKRFIFSEDGVKIRANQGHSIKVDVELKEKKPPLYLYHGTASYQDIMNCGFIKKMSRLHVHLSEDVETAKNVGTRHGKCTILRVRAEDMYIDGIKFYQSENGVWLTDDIPTKYVSI